MDSRYCNKNAVNGLDALTSWDWRSLSKMNSKPSKSVNLTDVTLEILSWLEGRRILANQIALLADELDRMTRSKDKRRTVGLGMSLVGAFAAMGLAVASGGVAVPLMVGAAASTGVAIGGILDANHSEFLKNLLETQSCTSAGKAWEADRNRYNRCSEVCSQINENEIQTRFHEKSWLKKLRDVLAIQKKEGTEQYFDKMDKLPVGGLAWIVRQLFTMKTFVDFVILVQERNQNNPCDMAIRFREVAKELKRQLFEDQAQLTQMLESSAGAGVSDPGFHEK